MRNVVSAVLVILALVVSAVAGPALWLQQNVIEEAGFVRLAGPLGGNKSFQEGLSSVVASQATASIDLPPQLSELATTLIQGAARGIYTDPGYDQAWSDTLRLSHELTFAAAGNKDVRGDLQLDVAPLVALISAKVSHSTGVELPAPKDVIVALEQPEVARFLPAATTLGGWGLWLLVIAVVLLIAGILMARRRSLTLILAGVGLAVVALLWLLASGIVSGVIGNLTTGPDAARQLAGELATVAQTSWQAGISAGFVAAGVLVVLGVGALIVKRRHTT